MSFFTGIENLEHTVAGWTEKVLTAIETKAPTIERIIDASLAYVGPALQIGLGALGQTALATEIGIIVAKAQTDMLAASALITDFGPTPTAASMFASVKTNLNAILTDSNVTNATTVSTVTKAVNEVGALATAVQTAATQIAAAAAPPTP